MSHNIKGASIANSIVTANHNDKNSNVRQRRVHSKSTKNLINSDQVKEMVPKAPTVNFFEEESSTENGSHNSEKSNGRNHLTSSKKENYASTSLSIPFDSIDTYAGSSLESNNDSNEKIYIQLQPHSSSESNSVVPEENVLPKKQFLNETNVTNTQQADVSSVDEHDSETDNDEASLLHLHTATKQTKSIQKQLTSNGLSVQGGRKATDSKPECARSIAFETLFPFLMAGFGMVAAGIVLDKVQHWTVFEKVSEIFILVPALLGLKGNLEMTLASRLSTYANCGYLDDPKKKWSIIRGNMIVVEAQAMVIAFLASFVAMVLGWIPDGKWETEHAIILMTGSLLTGAIASGLLGMVMIFVIVMSKKFGINPDNVATPIAASLGDLITLTLLSAIAKGLYVVLYNPNTAWIGPAIIAVFVILTPLFLWLSHRNEFTRDVIKHGWIPVISAMGISSAGGFILDFAVSKNPGVAVFSPVINGVGGNLVAVQASRISTYLHSSGYPLGHLPDADKPGCISPWKTFISSSNLHSVGARVLLAMVVPGQIVFVLIIQVLKAGHTSITPQFVAVYLLVSLIQVAILLQICNCMVFRLWKSGDDPDNSAIPYLTALGDLLGTALLAAGFLFLWLVGDRDMDVGD